MMGNPLPYILVGSVELGAVLPEDVLYGSLTYLLAGQV